MNDFYNVTEMRMNEFCDVTEMRMSNDNCCDISFETPTNLVVAGLLNGDIIEMNVVLVEWCRWSTSTPIFVHYCLYDNIKYYLWYDVCEYLNIDQSLVKKNRWVKYEYMYNYIVFMNINTKKNLKIIRLFIDETCGGNPPHTRIFETSNESKQESKQESPRESPLEY